MFSVTDQVITDWTEPILRGLITENASITDVFFIHFFSFFPDSISYFVYMRVCLVQIRYQFS